MARFIRARLSRIAILIGIVSAPQAALACPVCFGALEGPIADATNKAILTLLGITGGVLVAFAAFFIYLVRRASAESAVAIPQSPVMSPRSSIREETA